MPRKRRVYLIRKTHEPIEQEVLSNFSKVLDNIDLDISYFALTSRLRRAKERTGKALIRIKDENGNPITIEIREVD